MSLKKGATGALSSHCQCSVTHTQPSRSCAPCCHLSELSALVATTATRFPIFSLWSVTVQMTIIRERHSHLITDIMNRVSLSRFAPVCVSVRVRASNFACLTLSSGVLLKLDAAIPSIQRRTDCVWESRQSGYKFSIFDWCIPCVVDKKCRQRKTVFFTNIHLSFYLFFPHWKWRKGFKITSAGSKVLQTSSIMSRSSSMNKP